MLDETCHRVKLTIVIPHYNSPFSLEFLMNTIVLHNDMQVIIVDDNSDKYLEEYKVVQEKYGSSSVCFYKNETGSKGAGACRNVGLTYAVGEWILFADADDFFVDGWYERVSIYFRTEFDVIYFKPTSRNFETGKIAMRHLPYLLLIEEYKTKTYGYEEALRYNFSPPWSKLIRKSIVTNNKILFDEVLYSNDVMFSTKVGYYANEIAIDEETIYCVTDKQGTLTKNKSEEAYFIRNVVICKQYQFLKQRLPKEKFKKLDHWQVPVRLLGVLMNGYGWKKIVKYYLLFKNNGMPLLCCKFLSIKKIKEKKYMYKFKRNLKNKQV